MFYPFCLVLAVGYVICHINVAVVRTSRINQRVHMVIRSALIFQYLLINKCVAVPKILLCLKKACATICASVLPGLNILYKYTHEDSKIDTAYLYVTLMFINQKVLLARTCDAESIVKSITGATTSCGRAGTGIPLPRRLVRDRYLSNTSTIRKRVRVTNSS